MIDQGVNEVLSTYKGDRSELILLLQEIQTKLGYLPDRAMLQIARFLKVPESQVFGAASFYAQFRFVPAGLTIYPSLHVHVQFVLLVQILLLFLLR